MTEVPSLPALQHAKFIHALDLCRASQKFMLPYGGRLFADGDLRALDESETLRLPHPFIALEYMATRDNFEPGMGEPCRRRIVFAREGDEGIHITPAINFDANGFWSMMDECFVPYTNYIDRDASKKGSAFIKTRFPRGAPQQDYYDEVSALMCFLNALQCSNVKIERSETKKSKKVKAALPFDTYHILTIDTGRNGSGQSSGCGGDHRSPREHLRRGHIRRLESGRKVWVNATVVAANKGAGVVKKDYRVK